MKVINPHITAISIALTDTIPLHVYMVKGDDKAFLIDSGIKSMHGEIMEMIQQTDVKLKSILHTHSHHDHIGGNAQLIEKTGCQIIAPKAHAHWHEDWDAHYNEFARPFPEIFSDTQALRDEVFGIMDAPHKVDAFCKEGDVFKLGNNIELTCFMFSGHLLEEAGWYESKTKTLILGDVITLLDAPFIHGHLTVQGYRDSLKKLKNLIENKPVDQILMAHFPPMAPTAFKNLIQQAAAYIDTLESTIINLLKEAPLSLKALWVKTCDAMGKAHEFRSLSTVHAHIKDLQAKGIVRILPDEKIEYYGK